MLFYFLQQTWSQSRQGNPDGFTSESRIQDIQTAKRAALIRQADRMCTAEKAQSDAVLERLGLSRQVDSQPSPLPPAACRRTPKSCLQRRRRLSPLRDAPHLNAGHLYRNQSPQSLEEEEDTRSAASIGSVSSLSSADTHTPSELRAISLIGSPVEVTPLRPTPPPPPPRETTLTRRRVSRLPIFSFSAGKSCQDILLNGDNFLLWEFLLWEPPFYRYIGYDLNTVNWKKFE